MKTKLRGVKIWQVVPSSGGFGQHECTGPVWVRKSSIQPNPQLDGLIREQNGRLSVTAETWDGDPVVGILA